MEPITVIIYKVAILLLQVQIYVFLVWVQRVPFQVSLEQLSSISIIISLRVKFAKINYSNAPKVNQ